MGSSAGVANQLGQGNTFLGVSAGSTNTTGNENTYIGAGARGSAGLSNATAIGANALVTTSNTMVLGVSGIAVQVPGSLTVSGTLNATLPDSNLYIQNRVTPQASTNFHISGNGTVDGTLRGDVVLADTQFNIGLNRILFGDTSFNTFSGFGSGSQNTGTHNSFIGRNAGFNNIGGDHNTFVGSTTGFSSTGDKNTFPR